MCSVARQFVPADAREATRAHRSRRLTGQIAADATLIITATRSQRAHVALLDPAARNRCFTIREIQLLSGCGDRRSAPPADLPSLVEDINGRRGLVTTAAPGPWWKRRSSGSVLLDVDDGHLMDFRSHRRVLADLKDLTESVGERLIGPAE